MELLTEYFNDEGGSVGAKERFCCCSVLVKFNLETLYTIRSFFIRRNMRFLKLCYICTMVTQRGVNWLGFLFFFLLGSGSNVSYFFLILALRMRL